MSAGPPARLVAVVALGGALGAVARWGLTVTWPAGDGIGWTVVAINVGGSLLLASLGALGVVRRHRTLAAALGPGVLGGFTTLSAVSEETRGLLAAGHLGLGAAYTLGTLGAALAAVSLGARWSRAAQGGDP